MAVGFTSSNGSVKNLTNKVDGLTNNVVELNNRMNEIDIVTKKYYLNITPPPLSTVKTEGGHFTANYTSAITHDGQGRFLTAYFTEDSLNRDIAVMSTYIEYNIIVNGESIASSKANKGGYSSSCSYSLTGATTDTLRSFDYNTPVTLEISGKLLSNSTDTHNISTINVYKFNELVYTKTGDIQFSDSVSFVMDRDISILRSTATKNNNKYTINIYIEEYNSN